MSTLDKSISSPNKETELGRVQREIGEIKTDITLGRPVIIRNAILSAMAAILGTVGTIHQVSTSRDELNTLAIPAGAVGFLGIVGSVKNLRRVNRPASRDEEARLALLLTEEELLIRLSQQSR